MGSSDEERGGDGTDDEAKNPVSGEAAKPSVEKRS
eukprot:CAMPEP_0185903866 /NCGR_PEP_ID=MMETSP0196C-20130402/3165_1 /TAXON_ID=2932 /ORGANISM="Alexandrium fundyense, Strain CCMP1719" /LENGTH=34 /DNA_ID= /DNA_START= /DNA_END= /DNA_ORIENTATION=